MSKDVKGLRAMLNVDTHDSHQVARLIRRKFRPLDTDSEGTRGLQSQNDGSERGLRALAYGQIDSARDFILLFLYAIYSNNSVGTKNERLGASLC